jgi:hypothetical protein
MNIKAIVENHFEIVPGRSTKEEICFLCPEPGCHDVSGNRSVNVSTLKTSCWRCGKGGDFFKWAKHLGLELENVEEDIGTTFEDLETSLAEIEEPQVKGTEIVTEVQLPRGYTPLTYDGRDGYHRMASNMARRKHLYLEDLVDAGVGVAPDNHLWEPYAIFPVWEWGRVVYYQGRTLIDPYEESTKKFPSRKELPRGSRYWLYGIDELRNNKAGSVVVIVESILNVLSLRVELAARGLTEYSPVCIFKHKLSPEQLAKLLRCKGIREVTFLYDEDATAAAHNEANLLVNRFPKVTVTEMPQGDANDNASLAVDRLLVRRSPEVLVFRGS